MPKLHVFKYGGIKVKIIDTPGIGDTRGMWKDEENFKNIMRYIATFENIHVICILVKPNQARLTLIECCIKELIARQSKELCNNIVLCFTHSRETLYMPGNSLATIR